MKIPLILSFGEYQVKAHDTASYPTRIILHNNIINESELVLPHLPWAYPVIGLPAEVGELMNQFKKVIRDDNGEFSEEREVDMKDELGDILWYIAEICNIMKWSMNDIAINNIKKLQLRQKRNQIHGDKR